MAAQPDREADARALERIVERIAILDRAFASAQNHGYDGALRDPVNAYSFTRARLNEIEDIARAALQSAPPPTEERCPTRTPSELAYGFGIDRTEVLSICTRHGIPIFQGKVNVEAFREARAPSPVQPAPTQSDPDARGQDDG